MQGLAPFAIKSHEEAYYDQLWEELEAEYWAEQERLWLESLATETGSKDSEKVLDTVGTTH